MKYIIFYEIKLVIKYLNFIFKVKFYLINASL